MAKKYHAKPYDAPPHPDETTTALFTHKPSLIGNHYFTDRLTAEMRIARGRSMLNQLCVFRIDLPCYPQLWVDPLTVEIELLILVDPVRMLSNACRNPSLRRSLNLWIKLGR